MESNKRKVGGYYEKKAADYLKQQGLQIKVMNFRCNSGEIDLIARDVKYLVFVEVKYRSDKTSGDAAEAVGYWKQKIISKVAKYYIVTHYHTVDIACRFDVICFDGEEIRWLKDAFEYTE